MLMDFIFGKPAESNLNQRSQELNDLLLDEILKMYQQGPNPLPTYTAMAPDVAYSGPNTLLASLGMEGVARPDLPTTEIGGRTVYSSEALQKAMEEKFAAENPELYARLKNQVAAKMNPMSSVPTASSGGDDNEPPMTLREQIRSQDPERYAFVDDQLEVLHDGNHASMAAASSGQGLSDLASSGGIIGSVLGSIGSALGGSPTTTRMRGGGGGGR